MYTKIKALYQQASDYMDKTVTIGGWVKTVRDNKNFGFMEVNDGTFFKSIQVVLNQQLPNFDIVKKTSVGSSVTVVGTVVKSEGAKQAFEIHATQVTIDGDAPSDYPLQKKRHSLEFLRTIAYLRPRTNTFSAVFRVRSLASFAIHQFFNERDFVYVHTPIITGSDAEGAGQMFQVTTMDLNHVPMEDGAVNYKEDFFGKMTNLTVSGQLSAETFATAFRDVYTFGPTFRAENSNTTRHAAEFWMMEPEMAYADLTQNMDVAEDMLKHIIRYVLDHAKEEMAFFNSFIDEGLLARLDNVVSNRFERITYTEAIELLKKADITFDYPVEWGMDLQTEHERYITEKVYQKPVFVTDYPKEIKAFYMKLNEDNKTVRAMDLLVPGIGELMGGSQREERLDVLEKRMKELDMNLEDYWWYLDLRKYGTVVHSGFGLGFERCIMYITGMTNIRDVIPFPRTVNNAEF